MSLGNASACISIITRGTVLACKIVVPCSIIARIKGSIEAGRSSQDRVRSRFIAKGAAKHQGATNGVVRVSTHLEVTRRTTHIAHTVRYMDILAHEINTFATNTRSEQLVFHQAFPLF